MIAAQTVAEQHAERLRTLGGKIGEVGGNQFPGDVVGILLAQPVDALDHHVVSEDESFAADLENRAIVRQPARGGMRRQRAQSGDELGLAGQGLTPEKGR